MNLPDVFQNEAEVAEAVAWFRGCNADSIPDALTLFEELPSPRSISEHWSTTVRWEEAKAGERIACAYGRELAVRAAWLSWKARKTVEVAEDLVCKKPEGWPEKR